MVTTDIPPYVGSRTGMGLVRGDRGATVDTAELVKERRSEGWEAGTVVALLPAHNEAADIGPAVRSVLTQAERVVVVADNCTDDTVTLAREAGAEVIETVGNTAKKAGALNQGLEAVLLRRRTDFVVAMDADSALSEGFMEKAKSLFAAHPELGGLSGAVKAREPAAWLELAQAVEYARGSRTAGRRKGRVWVLSGAATVLRASVLREVAEGRGETLPGDRGSYFMEDSLTEDFELTLAVRSLGHECLSTRHCTVVTDLMPTLADLRKQRVRWARGTVETLAQYGMTKLTWKGWMTLGTGYVYSLLLPATLALLAVSWATYDGLSFDARWLAFLPVVVAEQYANARRAGVRLRAMGYVFVVLWVYDQLIFSFRWTALAQVARRSSRIWVT